MPRNGKWGYVCNIDDITREDLTEKVTFKQKLKENKGGACVYGESGAKNIPGRGNKCKCL